jgi:hypothetical protein
MEIQRATFGEQVSDGFAGEVQRDLPAAQPVNGGMPAGESLFELVGQFFHAGGVANDEPLVRSEPIHPIRITAKRIWYERQGLAQHVLAGTHEFLVRTPTQVKVAQVAANAQLNARIS